MIHGQPATDIINILGRNLRKNKMQGNSIKVLKLKLKWAQCGYCLLLIQSHSHNSCNSTESGLWYWYCTVYLHLQPFRSTLQCTMYKQLYYLYHYEYKLKRCAFQSDLVFLWDHVKRVCWLPGGCNNFHAVQMFISLDYSSIHCHWYSGGAITAITGAIMANGIAANMAYAPHVDFSILRHHHFN